MSDKKITELADGGAVQATDEFVVARAGGNVKIAGSQIGSGGGSSAPEAWIAVNGSGSTYDLGGGTGFSGHMVFDTLLGSDGDGLTWDVGDPDKIHLSVPGWYVFSCNDGWNQQTDETADGGSIWGMTIATPGSPNALRNVNQFAQTQYQKGGVWLSVYQPLIRVDSECDVTVNLHINGIASMENPSDYSPEFFGARISGLT